MDFDHQAADEGGSAVANLSQYPYTACRGFPEVKEDTPTSLYTQLMLTILR